MMPSSFRAAPIRLSAGTLVLLSVLAILSTRAYGQFDGPGVGPTTVPTPRAVPTSDPTLIYPATRSILLGFGDLLAIHIFGSLDYDPIVRVDASGSVNLPLTGPLQVSGLTVEDAETLIEKKLRSAGMYVNPQVTIQITESPNQFVTVTGEIHAIIPVQGERRLFDIIAAASLGRASTGGLQQQPPDSHIVTILRPGLSTPITVVIGTDPKDAANSNIPIFPHDTVILSRVGSIYVVGAFKTQGAIQLLPNAPLTLMKAAALSGGVGFEGRMNDLRIIRTVGTERKEIRVNISKVLMGKTPDPILQAEDIVFLPSDPIKAAIKSGGISTLINVANVLTYSLNR